MKKRFQIRPGLLLCLKFTLFSCIKIYAQSPVVTIDFNAHSMSVNHEDMSTVKSKTAFSGIDPMLSRLQAPDFTKGRKTFETQGPITVQITTLQPTCSTSGGITALASGGTPPYSYSIADPAFNQNMRNGYFPSMGEGTYTLVVKDAAGQIFTTNVTIAAYPNPLTLTASTVIPSTTCTSADASVSLIASNGSPPYEYSVDFENWQASNTFTNLSFGIYDFHVRDANGCIAVYGSFNSLPQMETNGCTHSYGISYTPFACNNNATLHLVGQGNPFEPPRTYTYSADGVNYQTSTDFNNIGYGPHIYYVKDNLGHVETVGVGFLHRCVLNIDTTSVSATCGNSDGSFRILTSGGTPPYQYSIDGINYQSSDSYSGLYSGSYTVFVKDAVGESTYAIGVIKDDCPELMLEATPAGCGQLNGIITASVINGVSPFEYSIDATTFQNSNIFNGLGPGAYTIIVRDAMGHTDTAAAVINGLCITVSITPVNVVCGQANGQLIVTASNGIPPYGYSIDGINFQLSNVFGGLGPGIYTITVRDGMRNLSTKSAEIKDTPGPTLLANVIHPSCTNDDGQITALASGGTGPIMYSLDGTNFQVAGQFTQLPSGSSYVLSVQDANGCAASVPVILLLDCPIITSVNTNDNCGNHSGAINIAVTNANDFGPYQFSLDGAAFQISNSFTGLTAGTYTITVKDILDRLYTLVATIKNSCLSVSLEGHDGTCGSNNGSITATGSDGTAPYTYSIDGINFQSGGTFSNLADGTYTITIKDVAGAVASGTVSLLTTAIPQVSATTLPATCLNNDGSIAVTLTAGTGPYLFSVDGGSFQATRQFNNLSGGDHQIMVKDAVGCTASETFNVDLINNLTLQAGPGTVICEGDDVVLNVGSNGDHFSWTPAGTLSNSTIAQPIASPVTTTKYFVTAFLGPCTALDSLIIEVNPAPLAIAGPNLSVCPGQDAQLHGSGGSTISWEPSQYLNDPAAQDPVSIHPLHTITYGLTVTDDKGCRSINNAATTVKVTAPPLVFAGNDTAVVINQTLQLAAQDVNNSGFVRYSWDPPIDLDNSAVKDPIATLRQNSVYRVTAVTPSGCTGTDEIMIRVFKGPEIYVPTAFTPGTDGKNDVIRALPVGIKKFNYFVIFNRWGTRVFYTKDPRQGWDGRVSGIIQPNDVFVWMVEGIDEHGIIIRKNGTLALIR